MRNNLVDCHRKITIPCSQMCTTPKENDIVTL